MDENCYTTTNNANVLKMASAKNMCFNDETATLKHLMGGKSADIENSCFAQKGVNKKRKALGAIDVNINNVANNKSYVTINKSYVTINKNYVTINDKENNVINNENYVTNNDINVSINEENYVINNEEKFVVKNREFNNDNFNVTNNKSYVINNKNYVTNNKSCVANNENYVAINEGNNVNIYNENYVTINDEENYVTNNEGKQNDVSIMDYSFNESTAKTAEKVYSQKSNSESKTADFIGLGTADEGLINSFGRKTSVERLRKSSEVKTSVERLIKNVDPETAVTNFPKTADYLNNYDAKTADEKDYKLSDGSFKQKTADYFFNSSEEEKSSFEIISTAVKNAEKCFGTSDEKSSSGVSMTICESGDVTKVEPSADKNVMDIKTGLVNGPEADEKCSLEQTVTLLDMFCMPEYVLDIFQFLKNIENELRPKPTYMSKQPDISHVMRSTVIDWLVEVSAEYKFSCRTLYCAVDMIDRFLSLMAVSRGKLQLLATSALYIAAKFEEIYPPDINEFVYITDNTYSREHVIRMEQLILKVLHFRVGTSAVTSDWLDACVRIMFTNQKSGDGKLTAVQRKVHYLAKKPLSSDGNVKSGDLPPFSHTFIPSAAVDFRKFQTAVPTNNIGNNNNFQIPTDYDFDYPNFIDHIGGSHFQSTRFETQKPFLPDLLLPRSAVPLTAKSVKRITAPFRCQIFTTTPVRPISLFSRRTLPSIPAVRLGTAGFESSRSSVIFTRARFTAPPFVPRTPRLSPITINSVPPIIRTPSAVKPPGLPRAPPFVPRTPRITPITINSVPPIIRTPSAVQPPGLPRVFVPMSIMAMNMDEWQCEFDSMKINANRKEINFECKTADGIYPVPGKNCVWYVACSNFYAWFMCCPHGTLFDVRSNICETADKITCDY